jgi:hypothetical protein
MQRLLRYYPLQVPCPVNYPGNQGLIAGEDGMTRPRVLIDAYLKPRVNSTFSGFQGIAKPAVTVHITPAKGR